MSCCCVKYVKPGKRQVFLSICFYDRNFFEVESGFLFRTLIVAGKCLFCADRLGGYFLGHLARAK
jgi:hypothetical protein